VLYPYAELHCISNFTFLRGASHAEELVERAHELGYAALAITDECSLAGVVRAHLQAKESGLPLIIGAEFSPFDMPHGKVLLLARNRQGYGNLSSLITFARMQAPKGQYKISFTELCRRSQSCLAIWLPNIRATDDAITQVARALKLAFSNHPVATQSQSGKNVWIGCELLSKGHDSAWLARLSAIASNCHLNLVACGDVHFHVRSRKNLHDTLSAIEHNKPIAELGFALQSNAEQHLRSRLRLGQIYPQAMLEETLEIASLCNFSLDELKYEYPEEIVPPGHTPTTWLRHITYEGSRTRYPDGLPTIVQKQIEHELALIADLHYEPYFLTVADIVQFARSQKILCQGRGSAANSAVCYCVGITEVDPARTSVLFERFISKERNEPPDIDVDFEHQRREEVIQYLYKKYGRHRAALTATVVTYRPRSAMRDVGKALGIDLQRLNQVSKSHQWWDGTSMNAERLSEQGFDASSAVVQHWVNLTNTLMSFPRHLSQHTGGFVIARHDLTQLVPVENASMPDRSVIQWDKDDLDALGLLKVDVLALGMLTAISRAMVMIGQRRNKHFRVQDIPAEDSETYDMICRADTVGVFQIESRAQMSMLPRLRPREFYDLVIEVAIVRPGPIQGGMVHPYLRRRQGLEQVEYPKDEIKPALARTLGIPIFQEQVMQIAILAAGFTPGEADQLRRAMAAWKRKGGIYKFYDKVVNGMLARGYSREFSERIFKQIEGFGEYGFPESHAASFALLVYISCWIKRHEPAAFLASLLNSQPMGFYAPAQLVRDAREHGVEVRGVDVLLSDTECTLEEADNPMGEILPADQIDYRPQPAVRLGLNQIRGLSNAACQRLVALRKERSKQFQQGQKDEYLFDSVEDLARAANLESKDLQALALSGALVVLAGHRAQAAWEVAGIKPMPSLLQDARFDEPPLVLEAPSEGQEIIADYQSIGISMGRHPLALLRPQLAKFKVETAQVLRTFSNGRLARASGIVTHRQRPETAKGTLFITLEDETGAINVIVWPALVEQYRKEVLRSQLMTVYGTWQRDADTGGQVMSLLAKRVVDHSWLMGSLLSTSASRSRDFR
jgi:DNA-directed DNA polymerase III PolC